MTYWENNQPVEVVQHASDQEGELPHSAERRLAEIREKIFSKVIEQINVASKTTKGSEEDRIEFARLNGMALILGIFDQSARQPAAVASEASGRRNGETP